MNISEICTRGVKFCGPQETLAAAAEKMWECDCGAIPVLSTTGKLVGMVTDRDVCIAVATRKALAAEVPVEEVMSGNVVACRLEDSVSRVLKIMREAQLRRIPILDEAGALKGIVTVKDIIQAIQNLPAGASREGLLQEAMLTLMAISQRRQPHTLQLAEVRAMVPGA